MHAFICVCLSVCMYWLFARRPNHSLTHRGLRFPIVWFRTISSELCGFEMVSSTCKEIPKASKPCVFVKSWGMFCGTERWIASDFAQHVKLYIVLERFGDGVRFHFGAKFVHFEANVYLTSDLISGDLKSIWALCLEPKEMCVFRFIIDLETKRWSLRHVRFLK